MEYPNVMLDTYEFIEKIGAGGGGEVYKAYHKRLQKNVVIKKIHSNITDVINPRAEADILKNLRNTYLPQVFDYVIQDGEVFTIMDYIPGKTFRQLLDEKQTFHKKQILKWAKQLTEVVSYLHTQNPPIIHGDIKPDNIILTPEDNICLIDFNISSGEEKGEAHTIGYTDGYSPPEQYNMFQETLEIKRTIQQEQFDNNADATVLLEELQEETQLQSSITQSQSIEKLQQEENSVNLTRPKIYAVIDERSDIYSIGATLYHIITGRKPEKAGSRIKPIEESNTKIGEGFLEIVKRCMKEKPEDRFKSAQQMLKALQNVAKTDRRYKKLWWGQELTFLFLMLFFAGFCIMAVKGVSIIKEEKLKEYQTYLLELSKACRTEKYEEVEELYKKAIKLKETEIEPYYYKCLSLYQIKEYQTEIYFIKEILQNQTFIESQFLADTYFITGNCYFELQDYNNAVFYFEKAVKINPKNHEYYRDYVISLARIGEIEKAEEILNQVIESGIENVSVFFMKAELAFIKEDYETSKDYYLQCIKDTSDSYMKMRAYLMCAKLYDIFYQSGQTNAVIKKIELLEEAHAILPVNLQLGILETLAQAYIDYGSQNKKNTYYKKAIELFLQEIEQGWDSYETYYNLSLLYQEIGEITKSYQTLNSMQKSYGDDYKIYKRFAFLEIEQQNMIVNENRNYEKFLEYYQKAVELYQVQIKNNKSDLEMQLLDDIYNQLIIGGWIKNE